MTKILAELEQSLKARGVSFTPPRRAVMGALLKGRGPLKAYDIVEKLKPMKPMSVYRALDFLAAHGLAHRIESLSAYVACVENHCRHRDSLYLICDDCGTTQELHDHALQAAIAASAKKASGFIAGHALLEVHGTCERCGG